MKASFFLPAVALLTSFVVALPKRTPAQEPTYSIHEGVSYRAISPLEIPAHIRFPQDSSSRGPKLENSNVPYNPGVYMCDGLNFTGQCIYVRPESNVCWNFPPEWNDRISSVGPDHGHRCGWFPHGGCNSGSALKDFPDCTGENCGGAFAGVYPGFPRLDSYPMVIWYSKGRTYKGFNKQLSSLKCKKM